MRSLSIGATLLAAWAAPAMFVGEAGSQASTGQRCSQRGCIRIVRAGDKVVFEFLGRTGDRRYQVCVAGPHDQACDAFPVARRGESRVVWNESFPDLGAGTYLATWYTSAGEVIGRGRFNRRRTTPPCRFADYRVVSRGAAGVVLASTDRKRRIDYEDYEACLFRVGSLLPLGGFSRNTAFYLNHFVWHGPQLAWFSYTEDDTTYGSVEQLDLRKPDLPPWGASAYDGPPAIGAWALGSVKQMRVRGDGAVAWIGCPFGRSRRVGGGNSEPYHCQSARGHPVYEVHAAPTATYRDDARLDSGSDIDPSSLRLCGRSVCWTKGGQPYSSRLLSRVSNSSVTLFADSANSAFSSMQE